MKTKPQKLFALKAQKLLGVSLEGIIG